MTQYQALYTLEGSTVVHSRRHFCDTVDEMKDFLWHLHPDIDYIISVAVVPYDYY